ncbi:MAG: CHASE3 domain-containing protein, partial [Verrucomicrobiota bacterium]
MRRLGNRFYKAIVVVWLTLSIGSVVLAAISWWNLSELLTQGRRLSDIRDDTDGILKSLLDAETGTRGYVITGDTNYLEPFHEATNSLMPQFTHLVSVVGGDPDFIQIVSDLRGQAELVVNWEQQVQTARARSLGRATDLINTGQGKTNMDVVRFSTDQINRSRSARLGKMREQLNRLVFRANLTSMVAGAAGAGAGIIAFWLSQVFARQQKRERNLTEAKLQA